TADGTATAAAPDSDYKAIDTMTLTFEPGETMKTVRVLVNGDTTRESDETFFVNLTNFRGSGSTGTVTGTGTIQNDDSGPAVAITDVSHPEGDSGTTDFIFSVTVTGPTELPVTVDFQTQDGTATLADSDYQSTSGSTTFNPGDAAKTITVLVNGDTKGEPDET